MSDIVLRDKEGTKKTYSGVEVIKIADSEGNYNNYVAEPTGEIKITANGSVDVSKYASATVSVLSEAPSLYSIEVTPTKQYQNIVPESGYDGFDEVIVNPIPDEYIIPNLVGIEITPTKGYQNIVPEDNYDGFDEVIVNPIPDEYIIPSGELEITENGTHDVTDKASVNVNVPSEAVAEWDGTGVVIEAIKTEEPTTDELAGTWVFGDSIGVGNKTWNVNFTSNNADFDSIEVKGNPDGGAGVSLYYIDTVLPHRIEVANDPFGGSAIFTSEAYRTITITSKLTEVTNGSALLTWLKANATKDTNEDGGSAE